MLRLFLSLISLMIFLFPGCALFTSPKERPVERDTIPLSRIFNRHLGSVFSMTPERRTVMVLTYHPETEDAKKRMAFICAEPPADVAENLTSSMRFFTEAQIKHPEVPIGNISADFYDAFASSSIKLFYRSQGIQLFRDGMYNLSLAFINGAIDKGQYVLQSQEILKSAAELIKIEIPSLEAKKINEALEHALAAQNAAKAARDDAKISKEAAEKALEDTKKILRKTKETEKPK